MCTSLCVDVCFFSSVSIQEGKRRFFLITAKFYLHYTTERTQKVEASALLSPSPTLQFIEHNRLPALKKLQQKDKMGECLMYQSRTRKL